MSRCARRCPQDRLPAHEQIELEELVAKATARPRDAEAICEWTLELLDASDAMHADLQRRFLRAFAYGIADIQDAL